MRPRLDAAGGDAERVLSLATVSTHEGDERPLSIPEDISLIEEGVKLLSA